MRIFAVTILLVSLALVGLVQTSESYCTSWSTEEWNSGSNSKETHWYFGSNDGSGQTQYEYSVQGTRYYFNGQYSYTKASLIGVYTNSSVLSWTYDYMNRMNFFGEVPLVGGKNFTTYAAEGFIPTANFTCTSNHSAIWGPSYPDYTSFDVVDMRNNDHNLEVFVHYSAPVETSYFRTIYFVKNVGTTAEKVSLTAFGVVWEHAGDISPISNDQRYYTGFSFEAGDMGANGDNPAARARWPVTFHARGQNGRDQTATVAYDSGYYKQSTVYITTLDAGQELAFMHIMSFGTNTSSALKNAADIDAEPDYIFHDLTADQLSMIRNWGGCQTIIGPTVTVTVTPPAQCSSGLTSDFAVQASSSRTDLTSGFTHRVVGIQDVELVPTQSSTTLSVPNGAGLVRHQLWYKECLVKETEFNACPTTASGPHY